MAARTLPHKQTQQNPLSRSHISSVQNHKPQTTPSALFEMKIHSTQSDSNLIFPPGFVLSQLFIRLSHSHFLLLSRIFLPSFSLPPFSPRSEKGKNLEPISLHLFHIPPNYTVVPLLLLFPSYFSLFLWLLFLIVVPVG